MKAKKHSMYATSKSRVIFTMDITATMMGREARSRWPAFSHDACAVMREMTMLSYCHRDRAVFVV